MPTSSSGNALTNNTIFVLSSKPFSELKIEERKKKKESKQKRRRWEDYKLHNPSRKLHFLYRKHEEVYSQLVIRPTVGVPPSLFTEATSLNKIRDSHSTLKVERHTKCSSRCNRLSAVRALGSRSMVNGGLIVSAQGALFDNLLPQMRSDILLNEFLQHRHHQH